MYMQTSDEDISGKSIFFQMGYGLAVYVEESARLQELNLGRWKVSGEIDGRKVFRVCHNWAGARLALKILKGRGARFITYQRLKDEE